MTEEYKIWVSCYQALADKLLGFKNNRKGLIDIVYQTFEEAGIKPPCLEDNNSKPTDIDPFTVFAMFNRGIKDVNRIAFIKALSNILHIDTQQPVSFEGIPVVNNMNATFYPFEQNREGNEFDYLWEYYDAAIQLADNRTEAAEQRFITAYENVRTIKFSLWKMTMGIYWIRPYYFITLDSRDRWFMDNDIYPNTCPQYCIDLIHNMKDVPDGKTYMKICDAFHRAFNEPDSKYKNFVEFSYDAWVKSNEVNDKAKKEKKKNEVAAISEPITKCWYVGASSKDSGTDYCSQFLKDGIWKHNFDDTNKKIFDKVKTMQVGDRIAIKAVYRQKFNIPFENNGKDVSVMAIKAIGQITENLGDGRTVKVDWTAFDTPKIWYFYTNQQTIWEVKRNDKWLTGALLDFTFNDVPQDYDKFLQDPYWNNLYSPELEEEGNDSNIEDSPLIPYSKEDFLKEVYMTKSKYDRLRNTLLYKKNIILQGAPGVGKTFAARRLAYSILGCKDKAKVEFVQFHQSYAYEDFVQGYKPVGDGFELKNGIFYKFCQKAQADLDPESKYFFIIDEINRGNLSRIFGELLMLIEKDYRGEKAAVHLAYTQDEEEKFSIPENLYIIGMMNTADRSLAIMDYALRRRFSFIEFVPAFNEKEEDMKTFWTYVQGKKNPKFEELIKAVQKLNEVIAADESLGKGFRIGHSYFITEEPITDELLTNIVENELIPLLEEYWFDAPDTANDYSEILRKTIE